MLPNRSFPPMNIAIGLKRPFWGGTCGIGEILLRARKERENVEVGNRSSLHWLSAIGRFLVDKRLHKWYHM